MRKQRIAIAAALCMTWPAMVLAASPHSRPAVPPVHNTVPASAPRADARFARWAMDNARWLSVGDFNTGWQQIQASLALHEQQGAFVGGRGRHAAPPVAALPLTRHAVAPVTPIAVLDLGDKRHRDVKQMRGVGLSPLH